jgi:methionyl-tRNA synthetase
MKKVLILAPPPTPNGDLHVGHLSGPYLRADIYKRYSRMRGIATYYLCGADEHQSYVRFKGEQIGLGPEATADKFAEEIQETLCAARIEVDYFARPRKLPQHQLLVEDFFRRLSAGGRLIEKAEECLYCESCNVYLFEAYVSGICPHCGVSTNGNACETCGQPNLCHDLRDPHCNKCGRAPALRSLNRVCMPLAPYEKQLRQYYDKAAISPHIRAVCEQIIEQGLPEIPVTHVTDWGIPVPGHHRQRFYVWFEMAAGLLAATDELAARNGEPRGWKGFWKEDDVKIVKFMGFDNGFFYSLFFPAIFHAYDPGIQLPEALIGNEFYRLNNAKFSTSRNHAIWGRDLLKKHNVDLVRFYLAYSAPETEQTNFTLADFQQVVGREVLGGVQQWLRELGRRIAAYSHATAPSPAIWTDSHSRFYEYLRQVPACMELAYGEKSFSTQLAARQLLELVRRSSAFGHSEEHWAQVNSRQLTYNTALALELAAARLFTIMAAPVMPLFAASLWKDLGQTASLHHAIWPEGMEWLAPGTHISNLQRKYFEAYEDVEQLPHAVSA